ncbi:MAG TPA: VWA domain-containing protein [Hyalangium sp.]|nr:VWA domain-containing protein [Hyalangium sp.]
MTRRLFAALLAAALTLVGCDVASGPVGDLGAVPGGAQDIGLARKKIANGEVPEPADFVAEGLYAEHDLPLEGAACDQVLCLRTATGIAPAIDTGKQEVFVQVGFSSNVNPATFRRKPLDVVLVIDHSGSMGGDPMEAVKEAARKLVEKLDADDTLSLVIFDDDVDTLVKQQRVGDRSALLKAIGKISADGGTCIECGLREGFKQLATRKLEPARARRLFLFTDAVPNVGATGEGEFMDLLRSNSVAGRDTTVFGVNIIFGQELVTKISAVRGSNYFYLSDAERTRKVFDEDFDFLVTPIAYDLHMQLTPAEGFRVEAVYGVPGVDPGASEASLDVATVFLSRRRGAIVARLSSSGEVQPNQPVVANGFSFMPVEGEAPPAVSLTARYEGSAPLSTTSSWYSQGTVRKTVALTNFILGARRACELWRSGEKAAAREIADKTAALLQAEAEALDDAPLRTEAELAVKLATLMTP